MAGKNFSAESKWQELNILHCSKCNLRTSDQAFYQAHHCRPKARTPHVSYDKDSAKFSCSICTVDIEEAEFGEHLELHVSLTPYICKYCTKECHSTTDIFTHLNTSHKQDAPVFYFRVSKRTKEIMQKAKINGKEFYHSINSNVVSDLSQSSVPQTFSNYAPAVIAPVPPPLIMSNALQNTPDSQVNPNIPAVNITVLTASQPRSHHSNFQYSRHITPQVIQRNSVRPMPSSLQNTVPSVNQQTINPSCMQVPILPQLKTVSPAVTQSYNIAFPLSQQSKVQSYAPPVQNTAPPRTVSVNQNIFKSIDLATPLHPPRQPRVLYREPSSKALSQSGSLLTPVAQYGQTQQTSTCNLPALSPAVPDTSRRQLPSQNHAANQASCNIPIKTLPMVVSGDPTIETENMASNVPISNNKQPTHLSVATETTDRQTRYNHLVPRRVPSFHRNEEESLKNMTDTVSPEHPVNVPYSVCINTGRNYSHTNQESTISSSCLNHSVDIKAVIKSEDSTTVEDNSSRQTDVDNFTHLSGNLENSQQNVQEIPSSSRYTESNACSLNETTGNQANAAANETFLYLLVVKKHFWCLKCSMQWPTDSDSFFRHIWEKHAHGTDFSCCPQGYSTNCHRLQVIVRTIHDQIHESSLSNQISSCFKIHTSTQSPAKSTRSQEFGICSSQSKHKETSYVSLIEESQKQSYVAIRNLPLVSAASICPRTVPVPQSLITHPEKTVPVSQSSKHPEKTVFASQLSITHSDKSICPLSTSLLTSFTPAQPIIIGSSNLTGNSKELNHCAVSLDNRSSTTLQDHSFGLRELQARKEITSGTVEVVRYEPEHIQQSCVPASGPDYPSTSIQSDHQVGNIAGYEDISDDDGDGSNSNKVVPRVTYCSSLDLPLDLSKKTPMSRRSVEDSSSLNAHTSGSIIRVERNSTDSIVADKVDDRSLRYFFACGFPNCGISHPKCNEFEAHSLQVHYLEKEFPCAHCATRTISIKDLLQHMKTHLQNKENTFSLLRNGEVIERFDYQAIFPLETFKKTTMTKFSETDDYLLFVCNICQSQFANLEELEEHLQTSFLKVLDCKHCGGFFLNTFSYQSHLSTEHAGLQQNYGETRHLLCQDREIGRRMYEYILQRSIHQQLCVEQSPVITVHNNQSILVKRESSSAPVITEAALDSNNIDACSNHRFSLTSNASNNQDIELSEAWSRMNPESITAVTDNNYQNSRNQQFPRNDNSLSFAESSLPLRTESSLPPDVACLLTVNSPPYGNLNNGKYGISTQTFFYTRNCIDKTQPASQTHNVESSTSELLAKYASQENQEARQSSDSSEKQLSHENQEIEQRFDLVSHENQEARQRLDYSTTHASHKNQDLEQRFDLGSHENQETIHSCNPSATNIASTGDHSLVTVAFSLDTLTARKILDHTNVGISQVHSPPSLNSSNTDKGSGSCLTQIVPKDCLQGNTHLTSRDEDETGLVLNKEGTFLHEGSEHGSIILKFPQPATQTSLLMAETSKLTNTELDILSSDTTDFEHTQKIISSIHEAEIPGSNSSGEYYNSSTVKTSDTCSDGNGFSNPVQQQLENHQIVSGTKEGGSTSRRDEGFGIPEQEHVSQSGQLINEMVSQVPGHISTDVPEVRELKDIRNDSPTAQSFSHTADHTLLQGNQVYENDIHNKIVFQLLQSGTIKHTYNKVLLQHNEKSINSNDDILVHIQDNAAMKVVEEAHQHTQYSTSQLASSQTSNPTKSSAPINTRTEVICHNVQDTSPSYTHKSSAMQEIIAETKQAVVTSTSNTPNQAHYKQTTAITKTIDIATIVSLQPTSAVKKTSEIATSVLSPQTAAVKKTMNNAANVPSQSTAVVKNTSDTASCVPSQQQSTTVSKTSALLPQTTAGKKSDTAAYMPSPQTTGVKKTSDTAASVPSQSNTAVKKTSDTTASVPPPQTTAVKKTNVPSPKTTSVMKTGVSSTQTTAVKATSVSSPQNAALKTTNLPSLQTTGVKKKSDTAASVPSQSNTAASVPSPQTTAVKKTNVPSPKTTSVMKTGVSSPQTTAVKRISLSLQTEAFKTSVQSLETASVEKTSGTTASVPSLQTTIVTKNLNTAENVPLPHASAVQKKSDTTASVPSQRTTAVKKTSDTAENLPSEQQTTAFNKTSDSAVIVLSPPQTTDAKKASVPSQSVPAAKETSGIAASVPSQSTNSVKKTNDIAAYSQPTTVVQKTSGTTTSVPSQPTTAVKKKNDTAAKIPSEQQATTVKKTSDTAVSVPSQSATAVKKTSDNTPSVPSQSTTAIKKTSDTAASVPSKSTTAVKKTNDIAAYSQPTTAMKKKNDTASKIPSEQQATTVKKTSDTAVSVPLQSATAVKKTSDNTPSVSSQSTTAIKKTSDTAASVPSKSTAAVKIISHTAANVPSSKTTAVKKTSNTAASVLSSQIVAVNKTSDTAASVPSSETTAVKKASDTTASVRSQPTTAVKKTTAFNKTSDSAVIVLSPPQTTDAKKASVPSQSVPAAKETSGIAASVPSQSTNSVKKTNDIAAYSQPTTVVQKTSGTTTSVPSQPTTAVKKKNDTAAKIPSEQQATTVKKTSDTAVSVPSQSATAVKKTSDNTPSVPSQSTTAIKKTSDTAASVPSKSTTAVKKTNDIAAYSQPTTAMKKKNDTASKIPSEQQATTVKKTSDTAVSVPLQSATAVKKTSDNTPSVSSQSTTAIKKTSDTAASVPSKSTAAVKIISHTAANVPSSKTTAVKKTSNTAASVLSSQIVAVNKTSDTAASVPSSETTAVKKASDTTASVRSQPTTAVKKTTAFNKTSDSAVIVLSPPQTTDAKKTSVPSQSVPAAKETSGIAASVPLSQTTAGRKTSDTAASVPSSLTTAVKKTSDTAASLPSSKSTVVNKTSDTAASVPSPQTPAFNKTSDTAASVLSPQSTSIKNTITHKEATFKNMSSNIKKDFVSFKESITSHEQMPVISNDEPAKNQSELEYNEDCSMVEAIRSDSEDMVSHYNSSIVGNFKKELPEGTKHSTEIKVCCNASPVKRKYKDKNKGSHSKRLKSEITTKPATALDDENLTTIDTTANVLSHSTTAVKKTSDTAASASVPSQSSTALKKTSDTAGSFLLQPISALKKTSVPSQSTTSVKIASDTTASVLLQPTSAVKKISHTAASVPSSQTPAFNKTSHTAASVPSQPTSAVKKTNDTASSLPIQSAASVKKTSDTTSSVPSQPISAVKKTNDTAGSVPSSQTTSVKKTSHTASGVPSQPISAVKKTNDTAGSVLLQPISAVKKTSDTAASLPSLSTNAGQKTNDTASSVPSQSTASVKKTSDTTSSVPSQPISAVKKTNDTAGSVFLQPISAVKKTNDTAGSVLLQPISAVKKISDTAASLPSQSTASVKKTSDTTSSVPSQPISAVKKTNDTAGSVFLQPISAVKKTSDTAASLPSPSTNAGKKTSDTAASVLLQPISAVKKTSDTAASLPSQSTASVKKTSDTTSSVPSQPISAVKKTNDTAGSVFLQPISAVKKTSDTAASLPSLSTNAGQKTNDTASSVPSQSTASVKKTSDTTSSVPSQPISAVKKTNDTAGSVLLQPISAVKKTSDTAASLPSLSTNAGQKTNDTASSVPSQSTASVKKTSDTTSSVPSQPISAVKKTNDTAGSVLLQPISAVKKISDTAASLPSQSTASVKKTSDTTSSVPSQPISAVKKTNDTAGSVFLQPISAVKKTSDTAASLPSPSTNAGKKTSDTAASVPSQSTTVFKETSDNTGSIVSLQTTTMNKTSDTAASGPSPQATSVMPVISNDEPAKNQSELEYDEDCSAVEAIRSDSEDMVGHYNSSIVGKFKKELPEGTKHSTEIKVCCNASLVKRKYKDKNKGSHSKRLKSEGTTKPATASNADNSTTSEGTFASDSYTVSNEHVKTQHPHDKSASVFKIPSSQPHSSEQAVKKRKQGSYNCLRSDCMFTCEYNTKDMTEHVKKHQYYWCGYCPLDSLTLFTSYLQLKNHTKFYHREAEVKLVSEPKCELLFKRINACEEFEDGVSTRKREKSNKLTVSSSKTKVKPRWKSNEGKLRTQAENSVKMQSKNQLEEPAVTTCKRSDEPKMISNVDEMPQSKKKYAETGSSISKATSDSRLDLITSVAARNGRLSFMQESFSQTGNNAKKSLVSEKQVTSPEVGLPLLHKMLSNNSPSNPSTSFQSLKLKEHDCQETGEHQHSGKYFHMLQEPRSVQCLSHNGNVSLDSVKGSCIHSSSSCMPEGKGKASLCGQNIFSQFQSTIETNGYKKSTSEYKSSHEMNRQVTLLQTTKIVSPSSLPDDQSQKYGTWTPSQLTIQTAAEGTHIQPENAEISRTSLFNNDFTCAQKRKNTSKPQEFSKTSTTLSNSQQKCTHFYSRKKNTLKCKKVIQVRLLNFFKQQVDYLPQLFLENGIKKVVLPQSLHQHFLAHKDSKYFRASQPF